MAERGSTLIPIQMLNNITSSMVYADAHNSSYRSGLQSFNLPASRVLKYITLTLYLTTFVFGLVGNGLVLYIITYLRDIRRKSVSNYYIWNLALADMLYILTLPFFCYATFTNDWVFGDAVCKISYVTKEVNKFASVFTLVALSVDRYLASYHTLAFLRTVRAGKIVCVTIWIICSIVATPYWMYATAVTKSGHTSCRIKWPTEKSIAPRAAWTYFQLTVSFLVPLVVIASSYVLLMYRLSTIMKCRTSNRVQRPNRRLTKTILVVVVTFLICQAPHHAVEIISLKKSEIIFLAKQEGTVFRPTQTEQVVFIYLHFTATILVFISSCCNPIIYGVFNENYRKLYKLVICRCRRAENSGDPPSFGDEAPCEPISLKIKFMFHPPCTKISQNNRDKKGIPLLQRPGDAAPPPAKDINVTMTTCT